MPIDSALVSRLMQHVDCLAGVIGPRHLGKPAAFQAAAGFVEKELTAGGWTTSRQRYPASGHEVANIVAEQGGTSRPHEILVVGAHYDTVPTTPGADDNASAVAVMIEVARRLKEIPTRRTVRLIGFACEEPPHYHLSEMGSQYSARQSRSAKEKIVGMLSLEMLGFFSSLPGSQQIPNSIPRLIRPWISTRADFVAAVGNLRSWRLAWKFRRGFRKSTKLPLLTLALPEKVEEIRRSDNSSFWDQGFPALMVTDTSFLRNPHYHQPSDTPDTLNYECMAQVVDGVLGGILQIAGTARRR
ncbi:M28 family peptidase [Planctomicrobium sp. SH664]|uniref:M28 family peptidase n=1 Tax=Planctomicrobium sp. SH664 TaxID=3448125 RepID=UPI003F5BC339